MSSIETDLDMDLRFSSLVVKVDGKSISVWHKDKLLLNIDSVSKLDVVCGISVCRLVAVTSNGDRIDVAYFTRRKEEAFRRFADAFNRGSEYGFEEKKPRAPSIGTIKWLWNILSKYKKALVIGVSSSLLLTFIGLLPPYLMKILIDSVLLSSSPSISLFVMIILVLVASHIIIALTTIYRGLVLSRLGYKVTVDLSETLYRHVMNLDLPQIEAIGVGRLTSRIINDVNSLNWLLVWAIPAIISNSFSIVATSSVMFYLNTKLALFILVPTPVIILLILRYRKRSRFLWHANWRRSSELYSKIYETIPNYLIVKSFVKEDYEVQTFRFLLDRVYESNVAIAKLNNWTWPLLGFVLNIATVGIWWYGGLQVLSRRMELGTITAFISYASQFYGIVNNLSNLIPAMQQSLVSAERIRELLSLTPKLKTGKNLCINDIDTIIFENVSFGYDPRTPVIKNFNLVVRKGEKIAIVGKSGSGKTTIAKLLLRYYDADEGRIIVNDYDIKDLNPKCLRSKVAYVPQEVVLFDATIGQNVAYGSGSYNPIEIIKACKIAMIHDEIVKMPFAYDTPLGERGSQVSGGQRQRLAIARAVLLNPSLYLFDEATSNLDVINEREVFMTIMNVAKNKTTIFITHNIFEVMLADKVIVLENGIIVEEGDPLSLLLNKKSKLYNMFKEQLISDDVREILTVIDIAKKELDKKSLELNIAKAEEVKITPSRTSQAKVNVVYRGKSYADVTPKLLFPITARYIVGLYTDNQSEVLIIDDYRKLDEESKKVLEKAISLNNKVFKIKSIRKVDFKGDYLQWELETDSGLTTIETYGRRSIMIFKDKVVMKDRYDNLFEALISDLDNRSIKIIEEML
ncbi:DUF1854 domain-containing protein [Ignisphaera sp. 4213-co]|uniref:DUF1854 domain-containing protein n=1 Tax=Ignisphaera cupida TaxID=3050454 RepID=A0ABD4Z7Y0_9CREN|nr:DUF1854 domain-containing protein [Ignisphaera sp. 4213-co]MDK6028980.1 DUF1854 domain-containing protein [Ignisphaera sp. 4213-co]